LRVAQKIEMTPCDRGRACDLGGGSVLDLGRLRFKEIGRYRSESAPTKVAESPTALRAFSQLILDRKAPEEPQI
jgi:hypothetical protein